MPVQKGSPAYLRKVERQNAKRTAERAAARLARHGGPVLPPDEALRLEYQKDPIRWAEAALGIDPRSLRWSQYGGAYDAHVWDGDVDPLVRVCEALVRGEWVGVESGSGTGKTFLAAILALWFLEVFPGSRVTTVATNEKQLHAALWKEIGLFWPRFVRRRPQADLVQLKLRMDPPHDAWLLSGMSAGVGAREASATKAQGLHAERMLIIVEEAPGVKEAMMTALQQTCVRPRQNLILAIGNPDSQQDPLHAFCVQPGIVHLRISAYDHPNVVLEDDDVIKGAVTVGGIEKAIARWGVGAPMFESRVRGVSPAQAVDALIRLDWVEAAAIRDVPGGAAALGVDVANSENGDFAAIARGSGARLESVVDFRCIDGSEMARQRVAPLLAAGIAPKRVGVDAVGVGAGAVSELKRLGYLVRAIMSGNPAEARKSEVEQYGCLRDQMWWQLALDLQRGLVGGPAFADKALQKELVSVKWELRKGKIVVQAKEFLRRLLRRSPNKADAVVYWNWARQGSGGGNISWLGAQGQW